MSAFQRTGDASLLSAPRCVWAVILFSGIFLVTCLPTRQLLAYSPCSSRRSGESKSLLPVDVTSSVVRGCDVFRCEWMRSLLVNVDVTTFVVSEYDLFVVRGCDDFCCEWI